MSIVKGGCKDDLTVLIYQTIKSTDFARLDKLFKEISCLMIPFLLETFNVFCCFQFKGRSCSHSIIRLGNQRQTKLLNSQICPSFCVDNLTWNDWNTSFFKEFLHLRFELGLFQVFGFCSKYIECVCYLARSLGPKGIRANGISAGPIKTLAAAGIKGFSSILAAVEAAAPLHRNVTIEEVGNAAAFLLSDLASGITGEITYVDAGYSNALGGVEG